MSSISNFIKVTDTLRIDDDTDRFLHVDGTFVHKVDFTHPISSLETITRFVKDIIVNEFAGVSNKEKQRFRRAFATVINNYHKDPAYKTARRFLKTIPSQKVSFPKDHPKLTVETIVDCIKRNFFSYKDGNRRYIANHIHDALVQSVEAVKDDPERDIVAVCCQLVKDNLKLPEVFLTPQQFERTYNLGWLSQYHPRILLKWTDESRRKFQLTLPEEYRDRLEEIFCDNDVENAIHKLRSQVL